MRQTPSSRHGAVAASSSLTDAALPSRLMSGVALFSRCGPVIAPICVVSIYLAGPQGQVVVAAALIVIGLQAWARAHAPDVRQHLPVTVLLPVFLPALFGATVAVPLIGAIVLFAATLARRGANRTYSLRPSSIAVAGSIIVIAGVACFQVATQASQTAGSNFGWQQLPGQNYGAAAVVLIVVLVSLVNGVFEELLWRVWLPSMFPSRRYLVVQWLFISTCFGLSHYFGTPGGRLGVTFASVFGLAMCVLREFTRGSVLWAVGVHIVADVILIGGLYGAFI